MAMRVGQGAPATLPSTAEAPQQSFLSSLLHPQRRFQQCATPWDSSPPSCLHHVTEAVRTFQQYKKQLQGKRRRLLLGTTNFIHLQ